MIAYERVKSQVSSRSNEIANNILIGNAKAEVEVHLNLTDLSTEERVLILKVLERDKLIQNEISAQFQLSPTKEESNAKKQPTLNEHAEGILCSIVILLHFIQTFLL